MLSSVKRDLIVPDEHDGVCSFCLKYALRKLPKLLGERSSPYCCILGVLHELSHFHEFPGVIIEDCIEHFHGESSLGQACWLEWHLCDFDVRFDAR